MDALWASWTEGRGRWEGARLGTKSETWLLALATTWEVSYLFWALALSCKRVQTPATHGVVGRLDKAGDWGLAVHKGDRYLH